MKAQLKQYFPNLQLGPSSLVLDLGAHEGWFTEACAQSGATVIAFEPNPWLWNKGSKRLRKYSNVTYLCAAVSAETGWRSLYFPRGYRKAPELYCGSASLVENNNQVDTETEVTVVTLDLDAILEQLGPITLVKSDVEGAEMEFWPAIAKHYEVIEHLAMETHPYYVPDSAAWLDEVSDFISTNDLDSRWRLDWP